MQLTNVKKNFFLTREHALVEIEVVSETAFKRQVKVIEGDNHGKTISVHPKGVA